jgi:hypothetical protein
MNWAKVGFGAVVIGSVIAGEYREGDALTIVIAVILTTVILWFAE